MKQRIFTRRQIIDEGSAVLKEAGIEEAELDAWYLLEYAAGISRAEYYGDPERELDCKQVEKYLEYVGRRKERVPLQHITGEQEFMGYPFFVDGRVLIPRQDTEILAEEALKVIRGMLQGDVGAGEQKIQVLDMCTGSGCILLSLMKLCPDISGVGADISKEALEVAKKNAKRLNVDADWICSDLFGALDVSGMSAASEGRFDVIVSNPPYIRSAEIEGLQDEVRLHDPWIALDGREDGLYFYRRIIKESVSYMKDKGVLLFEIGYDQRSAVAELMAERGYGQITVKKDLAGLDRVVMGVYNRKDGINYH